METVLYYRTRRWLFQVYTGSICHFVAYVMHWFIGIVVSISQTLLLCTLVYNLKPHSAFQLLTFVLLYADDTVIC